MIYAQRNELMEADDVTETIEALWDDVINGVTDGYVPPQSLEEQWDIAGLEQALHTEFNAKLPIQQWLDEEDDLHEETLRERIVETIKGEYAKKAEIIGDAARTFEKQIMLRILDTLWKEHLAAMDYLRQGIHLRAYAQKQPKQEYKREAFELFEELLHNVKVDVIRTLSRVQLQSQEDAEAVERKRREEEARARLNFDHQEASALEVPQAVAAGGGGAPARGPAPGPAARPDAPPQSPFVRRERKIGRNEPCPCGSGKKYKACHGKL